MRNKELSVASLTLDERNPRFRAPTNSTRESINALLADAPAKLVALAQDIAREGVNPTELPVVLVVKGRNIVAEGNRRVAALKLLKNPDLADDPQLQRKFRSAAKSGTGPDKIMCAVADTQEETRHWLELRHTGENGGVGVVPWNTEQQNNFRRNRGSQSDRGIIFCNAIEAKFSDEADLLADVTKVRRERLTTLGRLVGDPYVRTMMGFDFTNETVVFHYPHASVLTAVGRLFADLAGSISVSQLKSKDQREAYMGKIESALPARVDRLPKPVAAHQPPADNSSNGTNRTDAGPKSASPPKDADAATSTKTPTPPRRRDPEEKCIFQGLRLRSMHMRTSDVLAEAQKIEINTSPNLAAIMLRIVIDIAVTDAAEQQQWKKNQENLKDRIGVVLRMIDPKNEIPELHDARRHIAPNELMGIKSLNGFVHHWSTHPLTADIRKLSHVFRPMLEQLDTYLAEHKKS